MNLATGRFLLAAVILVLATRAGSATAGQILVSGDENITNALTGPGPGIFPGNARFFSNVLGSGTQVLVQGNDPGKPGDTDSPVANTNSYYGSLPGVTSTIQSGPVSAASLAGVNLFVSAIPATAFAPSEIAALSAFLGRRWDDLPHGRWSTLRSDSGRQPQRASHRPWELPEDRTRRSGLGRSRDDEFSDRGQPSDDRCNYILVRICFRSVGWHPTFLHEGRAGLHRRRGGRPRANCRDPGRDRYLGGTGLRLGSASANSVRRLSVNRLTHRESHPRTGHRRRSGRPRQGGPGCPRLAERSAASGPVSPIPDARRLRPAILTPSVLCSLEDLASASPVIAVATSASAQVQEKSAEEPAFAQGPEAPHHEPRHHRA